jgi:hypothetical protein
VLHDIKLIKMDEKLKVNIFYSWQSDLPNKYNRNFIENAIDSSIKKLHKSGEFEMELARERDNKSGALEISNEIFDDIKKSQIFIGDVSFINNSKNEKKRKTPNPNVLIELGFASSSLSWDNIILVFNSSFGEVEELPFDIRGRMVINYFLNKQNEDNKSEEKEKLAINLKRVIQGIIKNKISLEKDPVVKVFRYFLNKKDIFSEECRALYYAIIRNNGANFNLKLLKKEDFFESCKNINIHSQVLEDLNLKVWFDDWIIYLKNKIEKLKQIISEFYLIKEHIDIELIGLITNLDYIISKIQEICLISKSLVNDKLSIFSNYFFELFTYNEEFQKMFKNKYRLHIIEHQKKVNSHDLKYKNGISLI